MSETQHNGYLDGNSIAANAHVKYFENEISISGGYGLIESTDISLDAKQALSLLAWLQQEKATLEALAKEGHTNG